MKNSQKFNQNVNVWNAGEGGPQVRLRQAHETLHLMITSNRQEDASEIFKIFNQNVNVWNPGGGDPSAITAGTRDAARQDHTGDRLEDVSGMSSNISHFCCSLALTCQLTSSFFFSLCQVDAAVALINRLLQPDDEEMNLHKQLQLRELAALNGTLKDETFCFICGDPGEYSFIQCFFLWLTEVHGGLNTVHSVFWAAMRRGQPNEGALLRRYKIACPSCWPWHALLPPWAAMPSGGPHRQHII